LQTSGVVMIFEEPRPSTRTAAGTFGGPLPGPCVSIFWPPAAWLNPAWKKHRFLAGRKAKHHENYDLTYILIFRGVLLFL